MSHRPSVLSATMQKKIVGQKTKKNKRQWINLKDRSQRWSHEKKLRDIRARAALKRQRRKEEGVEEDGEPGYSTNFQEVTEKDGSWKKQRPYIPSAACFSEDCGSLAADPEEFLEKLYNPLYKKEERNVEEEGRARKKVNAVAVGEKESGRSTAAVHSIVDENVGKMNGRDIVAFPKEQESDFSFWRKQKATRFSTAAEGDIDDSNTRTKRKRAKKRKEQDQQARNGKDDELHHGEDEEEHSEEVEVEHSDHDLREVETISGRRIKSRRLASYSPQSVATCQAEHFFSEEKEEETRKRHAADFLETKGKCIVKGFGLKKAAQGSVVDASTSVAVTSDECPNRRMRELNGMIREEMRLRNKKGESQGQPPVSVCRDAGDSSESQRSLPKGVFYPFRNAMKEATRRKAAQQEERKRREEERQKAEREREICRRKRAKHRRQLVARTSRGQPVMKNVMQLLLDKITLKS